LAKNASDTTPLSDLEETIHEFCKQLMVPETLVEVKPESKFDSRSPANHQQAKGDILQRKFHIS